MNDEDCCVLVLNIGHVKREEPHYF